MIPVYFDWAVAFLIIWFFISQFIIPTIKNQRMFPFFRAQAAKKIETEIKKVEEELETTDLVEDLEKKKDQLKNKRSTK